MHWALRLERYAESSLCAAVVSDLNRHAAGRHAGRQKLGITYDNKNSWNNYNWYNPEFKFAAPPGEVVAGNARALRDRSPVAWAPASSRSALIFAFADLRT